MYSTDEDSTFAVSAALLGHGCIHESATSAYLRVDGMLDAPGQIYSSMLPAGMYLPGMHIRMSMHGLYLILLES